MASEYIDEKITQESFNTKKVVKYNIENTQ